MQCITVFVYGGENMKYPIADALVFPRIQRNRRWIVIAALLVIFELIRGTASAGTLTSSYFSSDANAIAVISGGTYDMNDPAWLDASYDQNRNAFAYKIFSALFMLGYQTEMSYNTSYNTPHLLAIHAFQSRNGFAVTNILNGTVLAEMDRQVAQREQALATTGSAFLLYDHMEALHPNDISKDTLATIYSSTMAALPQYLQMSAYETVQCIAGQCDGFIHDASGANLSSWPVPIDPDTVDYRFVGAYFDRLVNNMRMPSAAVHADTVLHEYAHYLDGFVYKTKYGYMPHLGFIDTRGFYNISYVLNESVYCQQRRSSDPMDWLTKYGFNPAYDGCSSGYSTGFEEWADSFSSYVTSGRDFRAAAQRSPMVAQKYAWLKNNVFGGVEYDTDLVHDTDSGCNDVVGESSQLPAYLHCRDSYVWNYTLPKLATFSLSAGSDFDGDAKADIAVRRPDTGMWYFLPSGTPGSYSAVQWGLATDIEVPGDYDGDGKADIAVWRPDSGIWFILPNSNPGTYLAIPWGMNGDIPVPGDYDGDGKIDIAVWRSSTGIWYELPSGSPGTCISVQWGLDTDIPAPGDYDGDRKTDIAVWRPGTGVWYILLSGSPGAYEGVQWGLNSDIPAPGDFDGDGKVDMAVWRPDTGVWFVLPSNSPGTYTATPWGMLSDIPVPGDFDGDGKMDIAVWRPGTGTWYILQNNATGTYTAVRWGMNGDTPISPLLYRCIQNPSEK
jgi:hypothetical protein